MKKQLDESVDAVRLRTAQQKLAEKTAQLQKEQKRASNLAKGLCNRDRQIRDLEKQLKETTEKLHNKTAQLDELFDDDFPVRK